MPESDKTTNWNKFYQMIYIDLPEMEEKENPLSKLFNPENLTNEEIFIRNQKALHGTCSFSSTKKPLSPTADENS